MSTTSELRRLVARALSAGELAAIAHVFELAHAPDASCDQLARDLVRAAEATGQLARLVAELRQRKPLVEWPDPAPEPTRTASEEVAGGAAPPEAQAPEPTVDDPFGGPGAKEPSAASRWADGADASARSRRRVVIVALLVAAALAAVVILVVALRTGRAVAPSGPLADLVADEVHGASRAVAARCGYRDVPGGPHDLLSLAASDCSAASTTDAASSVARPLSTATESAATSSEAQPVGRSAEPREPSPPAQPRAPSAPSCLDQCNAENRRCLREECGAEPTSGAAYEAYQRCAASCLQRSSRCRLRCH